MAWNYGQDITIFWPLLANVWTVLESLFYSTNGYVDQIVESVRSFFKHNVMQALDLWIKH